MKKSTILLPVFALLAYIGLPGYSGGISGNYTGSHATTGTAIGCGTAHTCHGGGDNRVSVALWLEDSVGNAILKYKPGRKYIIQMLATHTTSDVEPKFGFQLVAVTGYGLTSSRAGIFDPATLPSGTSLDTFGSSVVFQQHASLVAASGAGYYGSLYKTHIAWTAPPAGTDTVLVYGLACVVDGNSAADTLADKWNRLVYRIPEEDFTGITSLWTNAGFKIYPVPVLNELHMHTDTEIPGYYSVQVYDLNGVNIANCHVAGSALNTTIINTAAWATGMYQLVIKGEGVVYSMPVIKQ